MFVRHLDDGLEVGLGQEAADAADGDLFGRDDAGVLPVRGDGLLVDFLQARALKPKSLGTAHHPHGLDLDLRRR